MAYFKINNIDFSNCVNSLNVANKRSYNAQTNANGNTVVDYINSKRQIEVGIIPLNIERGKQLLETINSFNVSISFLNPKTNAIEEANCIITEDNVSYYTIQADKTILNGFNLKFIEL